MCSELYARTVGAAVDFLSTWNRPNVPAVEPTEKHTAAADERRRLLSEELRSAEASVAQLRRELDRLPDE